jgi:iron(III) transport system substrate-binding protein
MICLALAVPALADDAQKFDVSAACKEGTAGWDRILKEADTEGRVVFYSTRSAADNTRLLDAFMKRYPKIRASAIRLVGSTMSDRVDQEMKAGVPTADVVLYSDPNWIAAKVKNGDLLAPCGPSVALWRVGDKYYNVAETPPVTNEPWVLGYNTKLVNPAPTDWGSLVRPEYAGKLGLNEVSGMTVAIWCDIVASKAGADYFKRLAALKPKIYPNSAPLTQAMAAGEIAWSPYSLATTIEPLKAKGAPIDWIVPASGTFLLPRWALDLRKAPDPAAAMVLMDFLMSQEGQQNLNGDRQGITVAPGITLTNPLNVDLTKVVVVDQTKYGPGTLQKWTDAFNTLYR